MSQLLSTKFVAKSLAATVSVLMLSTVANAATAEQQQIQQLRQEVETLKSLIQQQQQVQLQHAAQIQQVKAAPAATGLKSKAGADVSLYGFARADANYIIEGADSDFSGVASTKNNVKDKLRSTVKTTRLGLDFKSNVEGADVGGKVEVDFAGSTTDGTGTAIRVRHAYLTYNNWLFGQTTSNFLGGYSPEMIDFSTNVGTGTARLPQVRYTTSLAPKTKLIFSAEQGKSSGISGTKKVGTVSNAGVVGTTDEQISSTQYSVPVLTAKVVQGFTGGEVSGRAFIEQYKDDYVHDKKIAYGVAGGVSFKPIDPLQLVADVSYVKGNNQYLIGSNSAYSVVNGSIEQNEAVAANVGATYKISPKLRSTLGYGTIIADDDTKFAKANTGSNKTLSQAWINFIYSPVKPIDLGVEYVKGDRKTFAGDKYNDDRVGVMAKYNF